MIGRMVMAFGAGAACLSTLVFALCAMGLARTPFLIAAAFLAGLAVAPLRWDIRAPALPRKWWIVFGAVAAPFAALYLVNAAAPEISPDGAGYHLGLVRRYLNHGGFFRITTNVLANLTQGCEMLFLVAYSVARHSAAALLHCAFLFALPLAMISYGRRVEAGAAGVIGAVLVFTAPVAGVAGTSAYVDVALAFSGFLMFYFLEIWDSRRAALPLIAAGLMGGFCFAIKYTGAFAILYALGFVALRARAWKPLAAVAASAALVALPWLIKNWIVVMNPFSPFFNRWFPNPYVHISFEDEFRNAMRHFNGASLGWSTPLDLTLRGGLLQGTLGPAFLLAPIGLAAILDVRGRRLLAAAALLAIPWFSNIGTRFLLPALPFAALAMGLVLIRRPKIAMAVIAVNAVLCWPDVLTLYCDPHSWRITRFPLKAALRIMPEEQFIATYAPEIRFARLLQDHVPPEGVVYTALPIMEAYTDRTILLNYTSALNSRIEDTLAAAAKPEMQPSHRVTLRFSPRDIRGFKMVAGSDAADWTVHEFEEPPPERIATALNPWDVSKAMDHRMATSWRAWQRVPKGAYVEADFGRAVRTGAVVLRTRANGLPGTIRLALRLDSNEWTESAATQETQTNASFNDLRGEAISELRQLGVTHLFIHDQEPLGPDFRAYEEQWQARLTAAAPPMRLYRISDGKSIDTREYLRNNTR